MKRNEPLKTSSRIAIIVKTKKFPVKLTTYFVKHTEAEGERTDQFSAHLKAMFVVLGEPQRPCFWQKKNLGSTMGLVGKESHQLRDYFFLLLLH